MTRTLVKTTLAATALVAVTLVSFGSTLDSTAATDATALDAALTETYAVAAVEATCAFSSGGGQHSGTGNCEYPW